MIENFQITCPECGSTAHFALGNDTCWVCDACGYKAEGDEFRTLRRAAVAAIHAEERSVDVPERAVSLTEEQQAVVNISSGRHLVLAPPGSGKTEMLTQRVLSAMRSGVAPDKMFCVTFTVRAGVEMRDRVIAATSQDPSLKGKAVPDIGNVHHFCNRFLAANDLLGDKKVVDEIAQRELMKDIWIQLKKELKERRQKAQAREENLSPQAVQLEFDLEERRVKDVVSVLDGFRENIPGGQKESDYYRALCDSLEACDAYYAKKRRNVFPELVQGATRLHRQKTGIPYRLLRPLPPPLAPLRDNGLLAAIAAGYAQIKSIFKVLDFDDLITATYCALKEGTKLKSDQKFDWIQIDEVQDLNAIQWEIIKMVSRNDATSVYFGDAEQTIFSFMGASSERLARVASSCEVHYFRKNFRSTSYLLDILVRYALRVLRSKSLFLPVPCGKVTGKGELICDSIGLEGCVQVAMRWLDSKIAENVALLVRTNQDADELEQIIKDTGNGIKYVKVSGVEVFEIPAMRDFMAFCSLLNKSGSLMDWARMFKRFGKDTDADRPIQDHIARRLVKVLMDAGVPFDEFFADGGFDVDRLRAQVSDSWQLDVLRRVHGQFARLWNDANLLMEATAPYRAFFNLFISTCRRQHLLDGYDLATHDELQKLQESVGAPPGEMDVYEHFSRRVEKFFQYLAKKDSISAAKDPAFTTVRFRDRLKKEWTEILQLREADLIVGDEKLIISTVHKAKGRQFDGVVIPRCNNGVYPSAYAKTWQDRDEDARVLYVALSRAKRHLAIGHDAKPSPFLGEILCCFKSGFLDFFKSGSSSDWLYQYNQVLESSAERKCCRPVVEKAFCEAPDKKCADPILKRMAISSLRYSEDSGMRDRIFGEILKSVPREPSESDIYVEVLRCIGEMKLTSFSDSLRRGFLISCYSAMRDMIHYAYLECYDGLIERKTASVDDAFGSAKKLSLMSRIFGSHSQGTGSVLDSEYGLGIEDALFVENGDVRVEAARLLYALTDDDRYSAFDGSESDWRRLRGHLNDKRVQVLRWMVSNKNYHLEEGPWKRHLQGLIADHGG